MVKDNVWAVSIDVLLLDPMSGAQSQDWSTMICQGAASYLSCKEMNTRATEKMEVMSLQHSLFYFPNHKQTVFARLTSSKSTRLQNDIRRSFCMPEGAPDLGRLLDMPEKSLGRATLGNWAKESGKLDWMLSLG